MVRRMPLTHCQLRYQSQDCRWWSTLAKARQPSRTLLWWQVLLLQGERIQHFLWACHKLTLHSAAWYHFRTRMQQRDWVGFQGSLGHVKFVTCLESLSDEQKNLLLLFTRYCLRKCLPYSAFICATNRGADKITFCIQTWEWVLLQYSIFFPLFTLLCIFFFYKYSCREEDLFFM